MSGEHYNRRNNSINIYPENCDLSMWPTQVAKLCNSLLHENDLDLIIRSQRYKGPGMVIQFLARVINSENLEDTTRTFNFEEDMFLAAAIRVLGSHYIFSLVLHLGATDSQLVVTSRVLGHVFNTWVERHAIIRPAKEDMALIGPATHNVYMMCHHRTCNRPSL